MEDQEALSDSQTIGQVGSVIRDTMMILVEDEPESSNLQLTVPEQSVTDVASTSPNRPNARIEEFGNCDFGADANDVIDDYFSTPLNDTTEFDTDHGLEESENVLDFELNEPSSSNIVGATSLQNSIEENAADQEGTDNFFKQDCCPKKCNTRLKKELITETRDAATENDYRCPDHVNHLHLILLGQLTALTLDHDALQNPTRSSNEGEKLHTNYMFRGHKVCRLLYQYVYNCGEKRLKNLKKQLKETGLEPRMHANLERPPRNTTDLQVIEAFQTFLTNFTDADALVLPGKMQNYSGNDPTIRILPSSLTKVEVHRLFTESSSYQMKYRQFCRFWIKFFPNIFIQKPRTDLCTECYKNTVSLGKLHGLGEEEKLDLIKKSESHLLRVMQERNIYREATTRIEGNRKLVQSVPLSFSGQMHYSFDFAQQVFLPFDAQQVGPLYFLAPYKVSLFGVACEPLGKFVLYVIPESVGGVGKGANIVISLFHHFLENFGVGEDQIYIHADNCSGQNKNNYLMQYAVWRTFVGLHKNFKLSFLPVGHTKFAPDLYFGSVKRAYRRSSVHSLEDFKAMLDKSCGKHVLPFLVANEEGDMNLKMYDWQSFFKNVKAGRIPGLLENFHFQCSDEAKGVMMHKKSYSDEQTTTQVLSSELSLSKNDLPDEIVVTGLSEIRKRYLFEKIREYVRDECKDVLCPKPVDPVLEDISLCAPTSSSSLIQVPTEIQSTLSRPQDQESTETQNQTVATTSDKKSRRTARCGYCQEEGHTNRIGKGEIPICPKRYEDEKSSRESSD